jgi:hypothetical protein
MGEVVGYLSVLVAMVVRSPMFISLLKFTPLNTRSTIFLPIPSGGWVERSQQQTWETS